MLMYNNNILINNLDIYLFDELLNYDTLYYYA